MDLDPSSEQSAREEWQQNAGKRKAEELGLDEDALMVAQILTGALGSVASRKSHKTKDSGRKSSSTNSPKSYPGELFCLLQKQLRQSRCHSSVFCRAPVHALHACMRRTA
eukprot:3500722-Rhodomonas_salina.3